jgi:hypothetical protein
MSTSLDLLHWAALVPSVVCFLLYEWSLPLLSLLPHTFGLMSAPRTSASHVGAMLVADVVCLVTHSARIFVFDGLTTPAIAKLASCLLLVVVAVVVVIAHSLDAPNSGGKCKDDRTPTSSSSSSVRSSFSNRNTNHSNRNRHIEPTDDESDGSSRL